MKESVQNTENKSKVSNVSEEKPEIKEDATSSSDKKPEKLSISKISHLQMDQKRGNDNFDLPDIKTDPGDGSILIKAQVDRVAFTSNTNFFTVLRSSVRSHSDTPEQIPEKLTLVGTAKNVNKGDIIYVRGNIVNDTKHGLQFQFTRIEQNTPMAKDKLIKFINKTVEGVGLNTIEKMFDELGMNAIEIIKKDPDVLKDKLHIPDKKARTITASIADPSKFNELISFLTINNISVNIAEEVWGDLGVNAINKIKENPYILAKYKDITFRKIDTIAYNKGMYGRDYRRFAAAIVKYLKTDLGEGNTITRYSDLWSEFCEGAPRSGMWLSRVSAFPEFISEKNERGELTGNTVSSNCLSLNMFSLLYRTLCEQEVLHDFPVPSLNDRMVYLESSYQIESNIIDKVYKRVIHNKINEDISDKKIDALLDDFQGDHDIVLADKQREAVHNMLHYRMMNITGGAGYGKTTLVATFLYVYDQLFKKPTYDEIDTMIDVAADEFHLDPSDVVYHTISLASPTGKAAHNLQDDTGMPATTLHKLLRIKPGNSDDSVTQSDVHLIGDYLIVDEASMIDERLFSTIMYCIDKDVNLVLIGDPNQLPSVGAGTVFKDLIGSRLLPTTKLEKVFRQDETSIIFKNDQAILRGAGTQDKDGTVFSSNLEDNNVFIEATNAQDVRNTTLDTIKYLVDKEGHAIDDIMVLTPKHKGIVGTEELNLALQRTMNKTANFALNPNANIPDGLDWQDIQNMSYRSVFNKTYYVGDRMLQLKNDYSDPDNVVMNGSIGYISKIITKDQEEEEEDNNKHLRHEKSGFEVTFPSDGAVKQYGIGKKLADLNTIDLGYTYTIHKAQGSGSPVVICIVDPSASNMLDRTLLYTAATRAKQKMIFIGKTALFNKAIKATKQRLRKTGLEIRLQLRYKNFLKKRKEIEETMNKKEA